MSTPLIPLPSQEELEKLAAEHTSIASLCRALGVSDSTLKARLGKEGKLESLKAALALRKRVPVSSSEVDDPDRIRIERLSGENKQLRN